jgi:hypothetical protein
MQRVSCADWTYDKCVIITVLVVVHFGSVAHPLFNRQRCKLEPLQAAMRHIARPPADSKREEVCAPHVRSLHLANSQALCVADDGCGSTAVVNATHPRVWRWRSHHVVLHVQRWLCASVRSTGSFDFCVCFVLTIVIVKNRRHDFEPNKMLQILTAGVDDENQIVAVMKKACFLSLLLLFPFVLTFFVCL